jgi:hypothetical protein
MSFILSRSQLQTTSPVLKLGRAESFKDFFQGTVM